MNRVKRRRLTTVSSFLCAAVFAVAAAQGQDRPNVLMIAIDDLRPELACYGADHIHSPNIDALAASSVRFDRAYCSVAVCGASRNSLLSGCRPETTRVWDFKTPLRSKMPEVLTLPQHFSQSGYQTAFIGKIYHNASDDAQSWNVDAKQVAPKVPGKGKGWINTADYAKDAADWKKAGLKNGPSTENGGDAPDDAYPDGQHANRAIKLLQHFADSDKPFFLALGFLKPHLPFNAPAKYWDMYDRESIAIPSRKKMIDSLPWARSSWGELTRYPDIANIKSGKFLDDATTRRLIHGYRASVSYVDAQLGRVLAELKNLNLDDNTIVVMWGDHGWYVGEYGEWCKHTNYEIATRVPLTIRVPKSVLADRQVGASERLAELLDLYPTLCELSGLSVPEHLHGHSLVPLLKDTAAPWREAAISQYVKNEPVVVDQPDGSQKRRSVANRGTSVRTERFRFTRWVRHKGGEFVAEELVDLLKDPDSTRNVIKSPEYAAELPRLRALAAQSATGVAPPTSK